MRKAAGAARTALVIQFLAEALLLGIAALFIAFSLLELCLPWINGVGRLSPDLDYTGDSPILLALAPASCRAAPLPASIRHGPVGHRPGPGPVIRQGPRRRRSGAYDF
jgi:hypothetical protein